MPRIVDVDVRRAELTDATARVIARSGIEAATMREIAAEAGWTTGALTHYFADKRELLLATFQSSLAARRSRRDELHRRLHDRAAASLVERRAADRRRSSAPLARHARRVQPCQRVETRWPTRSGTPIANSATT